jgi:hypothetical protein
VATARASPHAVSVSAVISAVVSVSVASTPTVSASGADLVGCDRLGDRRFVLDLGRELDRVELVHLLERRRLREVLGHRGEVGGIVLGEEALEELRHLVLEPADPALDALDLALDHRRVLLDLGLEPALASGDLRLGLLADPGDLLLRPLADRGDVVVGLAAERVRLGRRALVDLLDVGLRLGLELAQRVVPGILGGRLHGLREVGEELAGLLGRRRRRGRRRLGRRGIVAGEPQSDVAPVVPQPESACSAGACPPASGAASVVGQPSATSEAPPT